jgi:hypothetical protein
VEGMLGHCWTFLLLVDRMVSIYVWSPS